ncbi:MAG: flagellar biosynthetic protein FliO [Magnetospirillum sp.]|nr:flagellar biosynthetic protein FliO [Magnetospirillum sp.]
MDSTLYLRAAASLVLVLGLILAGLWAVRRFGLGGLRVIPARRRRLALVEGLSLDAKNRLVLVRRDEREHLLLIGGAGAVVVESGIAPPVPTENTP